MMENPAVIEALILKYARGKKFNKKEQAIWDEWTAQSDEHRRLPLLFKDAQWLRTKLRELEAIPIESIWENVQKQISAKGDPAIVIPLRPWWRRPSSYAGVAAAVLLFGLGWLGRIYNEKGGKQLVQSGGPAGDAQAVYYSIATGRTDPYTVQLADGSTVQVSYASKLQYPTAFNGKTREVFLEGEAYFDIKKDVSRPFVVHTKRQEIRVLGTRFNVMAYSNEPKSEVSLFDGSLLVRGGKDSVLLKPGEQAVGNEEGVTMKRITDSQRVMAWMDSCWRFEKTPLPVAIRQIARWYQMEVANPEQITGLTITGKYGHREQLDAILQNLQLAESGNVRLRREGNTIFILKGSPDSDPIDHNH
jgi:ferric-dicitrate binding protein FerR (iron transport regulator)